MVNKSCKIEGIGPNFYKILYWTSKKAHFNLNGPILIFINTTYDNLTVEKFYSYPTYFDGNIYGKHNTVTNIKSSYHRIYL